MMIYLLERKDLQKLKGQGPEKAAWACFELGTHVHESMEYMTFMEHFQGKLSMML